MNPDQTPKAKSGSILFAVYASLDHIDIYRSDPSLITGLDKQKFSAYNCKYFLTHNFSHMFWVLKRTVSLRRFF